MRPLTLHSSALNDAEYAVYIACLRDLVEDDESNMKAGDTFYESMHVGVREARAWLRGRYATLAPGMIDSVSLFTNVLYVVLTTGNGWLQILRLFCPNLAPGDLLTGGQLFAVLRLVYHVLGGKDVDNGLVFVQGECHPASICFSTPHSLSMLVWVSTLP